eukprot:8978924-Lingulodinium_polyedra.AAC.1
MAFWPTRAWHATGPTTAEPGDTVSIETGDARGVALSFWPRKVGNVARAAPGALLAAAASCE